MSHSIELCTLSPFQLHYIIATSAYYSDTRQDFYNLAPFEACSIDQCWLSISWSGFSIIKLLSWDSPRWINSLSMQINVISVWSKTLFIPADVLHCLRLEILKLCLHKCNNIFLSTYLVIFWNVARKCQQLLPLLK